MYSHSPNEHRLHFKNFHKIHFAQIIKMHSPHPRHTHTHTPQPPSKTYPTAVSCHCGSSKSVHVNIYCKLSEVKWTLKPFTRNSIQFCNCYLLALKCIRNKYTNFHKGVLCDGTTTSLRWTTKQNKASITVGFSVRLHISPLSPSLPPRLQWPCCSEYCWQFNTNNQQGPHAWFHNIFNIFVSGMESLPINFHGNLLMFSSWNRKPTEILVLLVNWKMPRTAAPCS